MTAALRLPGQTRSFGSPIGPNLLIGGAAAGLCLAMFLSLSIGATGITLTSLPRVLSAMLTGSYEPDIARKQLVLIDIRLPRMLLGLFVGAALAVAGAMMQGMFRNPLADPGLVGVSSGAALAAVATIAPADMLARMLVRPAELPLGVVMAMLGAPILLHMVVKRGMGRA